MDFSPSNYLESRIFCCDGIAVDAVCRPLYRHIVDCACPKTARVTLATRGNAAVLTRFVYSPNAVGVWHHQKVDGMYVDDVVRGAQTGQPIDFFILPDDLPADSHK